jgi:hypothetical protein
MFNCRVNGQSRLNCPENTKEKAMRLLRVTCCPKLGGDQMALLPIAQVNRLQTEKQSALTELRYGTPVSSCPNDSPNISST